MSRSIHRWILLSLLLIVPLLAQADSESARFLRNALHYYDAGNYEKSRAYFIAVLSEGSPKEQRLARQYLQRPELRKKQKSTKHRLSKEQRTNGLLSRGIRLYQEGKYEDAGRFLQAVVENGTPDQKILAQSYLNKPEMERGREGLLTEPEPAAETVKKEVESPVLLTGFISEGAAFRVSPPRQWTLLRTTAFGSGTGKLTDSITYKVSARTYYDAVFDITHQYPSSVADDEKTDLELRDTYLDISYGDWDARVGKQQIVWGEAIGAFVADVVNARDLRESILPSFDFIRIPQWGTDIEYSFEDFHAEAVWLPIAEMNLIPRPGSEFASPLPIIAGNQVVFAAEKTPSDSLSNSEYGSRLSYRAGGWDVSGFIDRTWVKSPVYALDFSPGVATLTPIHPRITIEGATFTKDLNGYIVKGEMAYSDGQYFSTTDPLVPQSLARKDTVQYLIGADHTFENNLSVDIQFTQSIIRHYDSNLIGQKASQSSIACQINRTFLDNHLGTGLETITDFPHFDYLVRPNLNVTWASHWRYSIGVDLFGGSSQGPFGQFSNRKRISTELRYTF